MIGKSWRVCAMTALVALAALTLKSFAQPPGRNGGGPGGGPGGFFGRGGGPGWLRTRVFFPHESSPISRLTVALATAHLVLATWLEVGCSTR